MLTVYMDESGFTGQDLMNQEQPVFVLVSTTMTHDECLALRVEYFSGTQGKELKHKNLGKYSKGQRRIVNLIEAIQDRQEFTVWICHKEFALLTYLVDLWVEPTMRREGLDLYRDGLNLALCNMSYYCLRSLQGDKFLSEHLRRFQLMMMDRKLPSFRQFWDNLLLAYQNADRETKDILVFFLSGGMNLGYDRLRQIPKRAMDPALTVAVETCSHWRKQTTDPLAVIHDKSSNLAKDKWLWDLITSPQVEETTISLGNKTLIYPLNIVRTEFRDSRSYLQLQFCDLVAGATAIWCRQFVGCPYPKDYVERLSEAGIEKMQIGSIWPEPEVDPEKLGMKGWSGEPVDFMAEQLRQLDPARREWR